MKKRSQKARSKKSELRTDGRRDQERKRGEAKKTFLGEKSMGEQADAKTVPGDLEGLGLTPSVTKPENEKEVGRQRACS